MGVHQIDSYTILNKFIDSNALGFPRYERKFRLRVSDAKISHAHLLNLGFSPIHNKRRVNSTYFDTSDYRCALENINGERYRIKPRLRWYGEQNYSDSISAYLEYKFRDGFVGYKYRKTISSALPGYEDIASTIENDLFFSVSPSIQISYDRNYFFHPSGIRATIDTNIVSCNLRSWRHADFMPINYDVVEFKYPIELDNFFRESIFLRFNQLSPYRLNKSSKYVEGLLSCQCIFG